MSTLIRLVVFLLIFSGVGFLQAGNSALEPSSTTYSNPSGGNSGDWFKILDVKPGSDYLIMKYYVRYPGMVKIKMYSDGELLWRGQYVNNHEGENKIMLRSKYLDAGRTYIFEFDYKDHQERHPVTL